METGKDSIAQEVRGGNPNTAPTATISRLLNWRWEGSFSFRTINTTDTKMPAATALPKPTIVVPKYPTATLVEGSVKLKQMTPTNPTTILFFLYFPSTLSNSYLFIL